ncbi:MAG: trypsin-like peptidase domain-containing protein [Planctomycetes bacterium]|nr:trypsin-like peptidase domain-containing protein [Planctomycetota bacterium]
MPRLTILTATALTLCTLAAPANAQFLSRLFAKPAPLAETQDAIESLVRSITPSVVAIEAHRPPTAGASDTRSAGAGFIITGDGKILTSEHVIADAISIYVTLHSGNRIRARRLASDPRADLAVIQIDTPSLTPVQWLDNPESLRRGHMVVAFGNPLGLSADGPAAPSMGLVSAIARPLPDSFGQSEDRYYGDMIQCTAPVGPGYSGGPLVDIHGRVVGILTAIASQNRPGESLAFAVPISQRTRAVIAKLARGEDVEYGYLGISARDDTTSADRPFNFTTVSSTNEPLAPRRAPVLTIITPGGPADRAGLQTGDAVLSVNATPISTADELVQLIGAAGPGRRVALTIRRDNRTLQATVDLTRRPSPTAQNASRQWLFRGAALGEVDAAMLGQLDAPAGALLVLMVTAGSPADRAGLTPGDVVVRVNGRGLTPDSADTLAALSDDCLLGLANGGSILLKPAALQP